MEEVKTLKTLKTPKQKFKTSTFVIFGRIEEKVFSLFSRHFHYQSENKRRKGKIQSRYRFSISLLPESHLEEWRTFSGSTLWWDDFEERDKAGRENDFTNCWTSDLMGNAKNDDEKWSCHRYSRLDWNIKLVFVFIINLPMTSRSKSLNWNFNCSYSTTWSKGEKSFFYIHRTFI